MLSAAAAEPDEGSAGGDGESMASGQDSGVWGGAGGHTMEANLLAEHAEGGAFNLLAYTYAGSSLSRMC